MAAGVTDRVWEIADVIGLLDSSRSEKREEGAIQRLSTKGPALGF
jgi:hypothetical protein